MAAEDTLSGADVAVAPLGGSPEHLSRSWAQAVSSTEIHDRWYSIAGETVLLRFAGEALEARLTSALAHLEASSGVDAVLTVHLWDSASTRAPEPPLPAPRSEDDPFGAVYLRDDGPAKLAYQPGPNILSAFDVPAGRAWYWIADAEQLPYWDAAAPIRQLLHWWLESRGHQLVHGGAVGTRSGGVLLVGRGGSGKSTSALSAIDSELLYAGDDYVAVTLDPTPTVHSVYTSGKVEPHHLERFPRLAGLVANDDRLADEKAIVYVHRHFPDRTTRSFPLRAILLPKVTGASPPRIVPATASAALRALAPSTIFQLHPSAGAALGKMARLVHALPAFSLELGPDIEAIPAAIAGVLADLDGS